MAKRRRWWRRTRKTRRKETCGIKEGKGEKNVEAE
jgi:hypothetical protein